MKGLRHALSGMFGYQEADCIISSVGSDEVNRILSDAYPGFDIWLNSLAEKPIKGLADRCWRSVRSWENGGGRCSSSRRMADAIEELNSDSPRALADTIFHSITDCTEPPFEASCLAEHIITDALRELKYLEGRCETHGF